jgi:hypothetical protein
MSGMASHAWLDPSRCALCGEPNECALAAEEGASAAGARDERCWCVREVFPESLLERVAEADRGRRCICRRCLTAASGDAEGGPDRP